MLRSLLLAAAALPCAFGGSSQHALALYGEDREGAAADATRVTFPLCNPTKIPSVIPPIPKPAAGGNPLLPEDSPVPAQTLEVRMRDGIGLHTLVFFPCKLVGLPKKGNVTRQVSLSLSLSLLSLSVTLPPYPKPHPHPLSGRR